MSLFRLLSSGCLLLAFAAPPTFADRTQVYSIQGAASADGGEQVEAELKKLPGLKKAAFDKQKVELAVRMKDGVTDAEVLAVAERVGIKMTVGPGQGSYLPLPDYPAGADVVKLTNDGQAVGKLEKLRVAGKFTVFDVYADWCGPCRLVDEALRELVTDRKDIAVRKLNVVDFDSPLSRSLGAGFESLPYVVVFDPAGRRTEIRGANVPKLKQSLAAGE